MKPYKFFLLTASILLLTQNLFAHGANCPCCTHPTSVNAPHGGSLEWTPDLVAELVQQGSSIRIYVMTRDLKPISTNELAIQGKISYPRNKPPAQAIEFTEDDISYTVKSQIPERIYRYTVTLDITYHEKKSSVQFVVEHLKEAAGALEHIRSHSYER